MSKQLLNLRRPLVFLLKVQNEIVQRPEERNLETSPMNISVFCPKAASWAGSSRVSHDVCFSTRYFCPLNPFYSPSNPVSYVRKRPKSIMTIFSNQEIVRSYWNKYELVNKVKEAWAARFEMMLSWYWCGSGGWCSAPRCSEGVAFSYNQPV